MNFDDWEKYEGLFEGSGTSEKYWLINTMTEEIGLFKLPKSQATSEYISEKMTCLICELLDIKCSKIDIGTYNTKIGSMSYLINSKEEEHIDGINLINKIYPHYNPNDLFDQKNNEYYSIEMVLNSVKEFKLEKDILKIMVLDYLIGNSDRHQNNWGILTAGNSVTISPLYDNGSSLCCYIEEDNIDSYLGNDKVRFDSLVISKSHSRIRINKNIKKEPTHYEVLKFMKINYYDSIIEIVNLICSIDWEIEIENIYSKMNCELLSNKRKALIKKYILRKVELMKNLFSERS